MFEGRVRVGAIWTRKVPYLFPKHGYFGRPIPHPHGLLQGERWEHLTAEKVVQQWISSLRSEGRAFEVIEENGEIIVRSVGEPTR